MEYGLDSEKWMIPPTSEGLYRLIVWVSLLTSHPILTKTSLTHSTIGYVDDYQIHPPYQVYSNPNDS